MKRQAQGLASEAVMPSGGKEGKTRNKKGIKEGSTEGLKRVEVFANAVEKGRSDTPQPIYTKS